MVVMSRELGGAAKHETSSLPSILGLLRPLCRRGNCEVRPSNARLASSTSDWSAIFESPAAAPVDTETLKR